VQELQRRGEVTELRGQLAAVQQTLSAKLDAVETAQGTNTNPSIQNASHLHCVSTEPIKAGVMSSVRCVHDGVPKLSGAASRIYDSGSGE
jgi:hypothetical protein